MGWQGIKKKKATRKDEGGKLMEGEKGFRVFDRKGKKNKEQTE